MKLTEVKKILPFLIIALILATIITVTVIIILNKPSSTNSTSKIGNTPDTDPIYQKQADEAYKKKLASSPDPSQLVAELILKLPYNGTNFSLDYSYDNNTFTLTYKKGFETQGNAGFNQFLLQNNVDKKYLVHLITKVQ